MSSSTTTTTTTTTRSFHHRSIPPLESARWSRWRNSLLLPTTPSFLRQSTQRRSLFIQTASTPNPESLKFIPNGRLVLGHNSDRGGVANASDPSLGEYDSANDSVEEKDTNGIYLTRKDHVLIARSPLAKLLFNLDVGVKSIYLGYDFLTVTKYAEAHWQHLQTPIFGAIMDFYATGEPTLRDAPIITDTTIHDDDDEVVAMIKELLETRIRPAVQEDGGDIKYVGFEEETGIVTVALAGSCVGCPSSSVTLKNGVENMLMHYIPEVKSVVSLEEEDDDEDEDDGEGYGGSESGSGGAEKVVVEKTGADDDEEKRKMKAYKDKLAAAGIPFSD
jgi:Fe-S cluster biogenesis protein NfuA